MSNEPPTPSSQPDPTPECLECHRPFTKVKRWQKYCDRFCQSKWNNRKVQGPVNYRILLKESGLEEPIFIKQLENLKQIAIQRLIQQPDPLTEFTYNILNKIQKSYHFYNSERK